jgi:hypothetical protein
MHERLAAGLSTALILVTPAVARAPVSDPPAASLAAVDPVLVGTWKLESPGSPIYWVVRSDGVYRVHGPGAPARQFGKMEAAKGRWTVQSAVWADQGTYTLAGGRRWTVAGRGGTGTWTRVWTPGEGSTAATPGGGACRLVSPAEVAKVLFAPATGGPDVRAGEGGCAFRSTFSSLDGVTIRMRQNAGGFFQNLRKGIGARAIDVPGVGNQAWAQATTSSLQLQFLKGSSWVTIELGLTPQAALEDLPYLTALARAAAGRL